jgi:hypothetical protein
MVVNEILNLLNRHDCQFMLIGGMNFMLRHQPILTYDVDVWIEDSPENRNRCEIALSAMKAEWGKTENDWGPVSELPSGWLSQQALYCLITPHGALDVFRSVAGLDDWNSCRQRSVVEYTAEGISYFGLSDEDMLKCQLVLTEAEQKTDRVRFLRNAISSKH